jgi:YidC/Oxa1 family membrane protein insertase
MFFFTPEETPTSKPKPATEQQASSSSNSNPDIQDAPKLVTTPSTAIAHVDADSTLKAIAQGTEQLITVENDLYKAQFSSKGATLRSLKLKTYTKYDRKTPVELVSASKTGAIGLEFTTPSNRLIDTRALYFTPEKQPDGSVVQVGNQAELAFTAPMNGGTLRQVYSFKKGSYEVGLRVEMIKPESVATSQGYDLVWSGGVPFSEQGVYQEAEGANSHARSGGEVVSIDIMKDSNKLSQQLSGKVDWVAVKNRFFTNVMIPTAETKGGAINGVMVGEWEKANYWEDYSARLEMPRPAEGKPHQYKLYMGPMDSKLLNAYDLDLYALIDTGGWMAAIARFFSQWIFLPVFGFFHTFIPNYGIIILLFALLVKVVLHPLTKSSMMSMAKMSLLAPKMKEIQTMYADDKAKQQEAMMKVYKETGANPLGGCLPMLLQMPILIAMYRFFPNAIQLRQSDFLWANDLAAPDMIMHLPFSIPFYGEWVTGFAILMALSMVVQMQLQPTAAPSNDPSQKVMKYMMPVMMLCVFNGFASGLNVYYFAFNVFTAIQQRWINQHMKAQGLVATPAAAPNATKPKPTVAKSKK